MRLASERRAAKAESMRVLLMRCDVVLFGFGVLCRSLPGSASPQAVQVANSAPPAPRRPRAAAEKVAEHVCAMSGVVGGRPTPRLPHGAAQSPVKMCAAAPHMAGSRAVVRHTARVA